MSLAVGENKRIGSFGHLEELQTMGMSLAVGTLGSEGQRQFGKQTKRRRKRQTQWTPRTNQTLQEQLLKRPYRPNNLQPHKMMQPMNAGFAVAGFNNACNTRALPWNIFEALRLLASSFLEYGHSSISLNVLVCMKHFVE